MLRSTPKYKEKLWLAARLTHFPLESLGLKRNYENIVISDKACVCSATDNLISKGVKLGSPTSTAQLLHDAQDPSPCRVYEREYDTESKLLEKLCHDLYDCTPHIEIYRVVSPNNIEEASLLLELSTCIQLFKGIENIVNNISRIFDKYQLSYCYGKGHTKHIAWILSHRDQEIDKEYRYCDYIEQIADMPIDYLYEYPNEVIQLKKCGFIFFDDIIKHVNKESLHSLCSRFGESFIEHICDVFDIENNFLQKSIFQKPTTTYQPRYSFSSSLQFEYPVDNIEQLMHPINILLAELTSQLIQRQTQTQEICWSIYDIYHNKHSFYVNFERLYREYQLAAELTMIQVERESLPFEIDTLELCCEKILPVDFKKQSLIGNPISYKISHSLIIVTEKIKARLGEDAMFTLSEKESHIPELSFKKESFSSEAQTFSPSVNNVKGDRPSWIFNIPVKIGRRQNELFWRGKLELLQGPERIEGVWWVKPTGRDYFIAKRDDHVRLWIFHDFYQDEWFVHGVFA